MNSNIIALNKILWKIPLLIGISIVFSSCNGKNSSQNSKAPEKAITLGKTVSELDQSIWVIFQDLDSDFWFGSKENGVFRYNGRELLH
ncbi:MAG: hypothetical protein KJO63_02180, partial [Maribacter sp.]|nr:hypothetical protein [Maribacter sp.]